MKTINFLKVAVLLPLIYIAAACNNNGAYNEEMGDDNSTNQRGEVMNDNSDAYNRNGEDPQQFIRHAASDGMKEVRMAEVAMERSGNQEVKNLAQMIKNDHQAANNRLREITRAQGWTMPGNMLEKHQEEVERLRDNSAEDFDRKYVSMMIDGHEKAIEKFEKMANNIGTSVGDTEGMAGGNNNNANSENRRTMTEGADRTAGNRNYQQLRSWINETLPTLRKHLEHCRNLRNQLQQ